MLAKQILIAVFFVAILGVEVTTAQSDYNFYTAGLSFRPIIPSNLLQTATIEVSGSTGETNENLRMTIDQNLGFSFGMVIRKNFTQRFAMETGVNFVRRGYDISVVDRETGTESAQDFGLSGYEVPLMALVYIRLGDQLYMNTSLGLSLDIMARAVVNGTEYFDHFTAIRKINGGVVANVGVEYRTKDSGTIYLGATYHQPTGPIGDSKINYFFDSSGSEASLETPLNGTYLTADLRYFFNENNDGRRR